MKNEGLAGGATSQTINVLHITAGAECCDDKSLRFAAVEDGRTVHAGKYAGITGDGAQIRNTATVNTTTGIEDILAIELFLDFIKGAGDVVAVDVFIAELFAQGNRSFLGDSFDGDLALGVAVVAEGFLDLVRSVGFAEFGNFRRCYDEVVFFLCFAGELSQFLLGRDDWLNRFLAVLKCFVEAFVRDELGRAFDHHHFGFAADVDKVEVGVEHLIVCRVGHELTVDLADAYAADRAVPWSVRDQCRSGRSIDHEYVRFVDLVGSEQDTDNLHFVHEALRKERTEWTVAESGSEDFFFGGLAFTLEVASGEFTAGGKFLAIVNGEWEEVLPWTQGGGDCSRYEEFGFSLTDGDRSAGEAGECTCGDFNAETFDGDVVFLFHSFIYLRFLGLAVQGSDLSGLPFGQLLMKAVAKRKSRSP